MHILLYKRNHLINASGGAEKMMITYANEFSRKGHKVTLATRDEQDGKLFFPLDSGVIFKHFHFCFSSFRRFIGKLLSKIGIIEKMPYFNRELAISNMLNSYCNETKPDVIIVAGIQELIDFSAYGIKKCPIIMMMHSHPNNYFNSKRIAFYRRFVNNADAIQVLMPSYISALPDNYTGKTVRIGNPVCIAQNTDVLDKKNIIIYLARLEKGKQQHLLIEAFSKIAALYPDWQVHFYGAVADKKYANYCQTLVTQYKLETQILFKGITTKAGQVLREARICAFPSAFEGFSLAQTEAMAVGLPVIGFDYCSGVNELIDNGKNGFLVKDIDEFADKLSLLIKDEKLRYSIGDFAKQITEEYSMNSIISQWEQLIDEVCGRFHETRN